MPKNLCLLLILFCIGFLGLTCSAQENDFQHGLMNVGVGGVIGGLGAVINKEPDQRLGKTLLKGFAQGALGGYFVFESKRLVRTFAREKNYNYIWPSKIVNAVGSSIIENAAANRDFWERFYFNLAFNRIEINFKNEFKLKYRIMPVSLSRAIFLFSKTRLDLDRSMVFGTLVFKERSPVLLEERPASGRAYLNLILLRRGMGQETEAHEIIHVYQSQNFAGINTFLDAPISKLVKRNKYAKLYDKIFYTDFHAIFMLSLYNLEMELNGYRNISFEKEARYFSN